MRPPGLFAPASYGGKQGLRKLNPAPIVSPVKSAE
jgi:hypothetical protein